MKKSTSTWCYGEKQEVTEFKDDESPGQSRTKDTLPSEAYLHACCMVWDPFVLPQESWWGLTGKRLAFCETTWLKSSPALLACNRPTDLFSSRRQHKDAQIYHSKYHHYLVCRKPSCLTVSKTKLQINSHRFPPMSWIHHPISRVVILFWYQTYGAWKTGIFRNYAYFISVLSHKFSSCANLLKEHFFKNQQHRKK